MLEECLESSLWGGWRGGGRQRWVDTLLGHMKQIGVYPKDSLVGFKQGHMVYPDLHLTYLSEAQ